MIKWVSLCIGTLIGGGARYVLAGFVYQSFGSYFPYRTFVVNLNVIVYRANWG